jgi:starvation-inducible DNA-binding protein
MHPFADAFRLFSPRLSFARTTTKIVIFAFDTKQPQSMEANIGLEESAKEKTCIVLETLLADTVILAAKTRGYHWNVRGPHFGPLHELFEKQYEELAEQTDAIAERVRILGGFPTITLAGYLAAARLKEAADISPNDEEMLKDLLDDREALTRYLRGDLKTVQELGDETTADFLIDILTAHEKAAWFLRAHLE